MHIAGPSQSKSLVLAYTDEKKLPKPFNYKYSL